jgi:hypothetical protein
MNEHDPIEAELAALMPLPPSPALREGITNRLQTAVQLPAARTSGVWWSAAAAGIVLTAGWIAVSIVRREPSAKSEPSSAFASVELPVAAAFDDALPTVWAYRHALDRSPQDLDALLDKHTASAPRNNGRPSPHFYIGLNSEHLLNGEL